jgi:molecular chaperone GrpE
MSKQKKDSKSKTTAQKVRPSDKKSLEKEIEKIKAKLEETEKAAEDYLTKLKYLQAEFENYKKMADREREKIIQYANEELIIKLLDVYENLERALESGKKSNNKEALMKGVEITYNQLKDILEREGLKPIKTVGEKFDPFKHEAVMKENKEDCEEDIILEEFQRGYMLKDKVIRYSKVKVCKR